MTFRVDSRVIGFAHKRQWDISKPSRGLGDTIAKITHATGLQKLIKVLRLPCRCPERQEALNRLVKY